MGLDGAYIQTAGTRPSLTWSCGFLSPALFLNSPASPQGCTIAETPHPLPFQPGDRHIWILFLLVHICKWAEDTVAEPQTQELTSKKGSWSYVPGDGKGHTCSHEGHPFVFGVVWPFLSLVGLRGNREGALSIHHMLGGWHKQRHWDSL